MGVTCDKMYLNSAVRTLAGYEQINIALIGLDTAGKTTLLYRLKVDDVVSVIPTTGFNVETVTYKNFDFKCWDVGGKGNGRALWQQYYSMVDAIFFVVDSSDHERMSEAREEIMRAAGDPKLIDCPIAVLANKQDQPGALSKTEVAKVLQLDQLHQEWHVEATCSLTGQGLYEALDWLIGRLCAKRSSNPSLIGEVTQWLNDVTSSPCPTNPDVPLQRADKEGGGPP